VSEASAAPPLSAGQEKPGRHCYVGAPQIFVLDQAVWFVERAFGETSYLVGSATKTVNFRDVDVRMIMGDAKFELLFGAHGDTQHTPFWQLICTSVSLYLQKQTGLPVDFQIQSMTSANRRFSSKGGHLRHPLGMMITDPAPVWEGLGFLDTAVDLVAGAAAEDAP
jgi:hypothetical protein